MSVASRNVRTRNVWTRTAPLAARSSRPLLPRPLLGACFAVAALFAGIGVSGAADAQSQRNWINPDVMALREEVEQLRQEVSRLSGGDFQPSSLSSGGGASLSAGDGTRLDRIEAELRRMIGSLERLEYEQRQRAATLESLEQEMRFRVDALERGEVADLSQMPQPSGPTNLPPAGGQTAVYAGAGGYSGGAGAATAGGAAAGGAGVLGAINGIGQQDSVVDSPRFEGVGAQPPSGGQPASGGQFGALPAGGVPAGGVPAGGSEAAGQDPNLVFDSALEALRAGAFDVAEEQFSAFIQANPSDPRVGDANYWLGETYYVRGQYDLAARQFLNGFRDHPESTKAPDSLLKLGMTLSQLNQTAEACATLGQVPVRFPDASQTVLRRADLESKRAGCR